MAIKSYVITQPCSSPIVRITGIPQRPQEIRIKKFMKGEVIKGELKHANDKPAFILVAGCMVVPVSCVKELVTKDVVSSLVGDNPQVPKAIAPSKNPKVRYVDAVILGSLVGVAAVFGAEKQGWIEQPDKKNKLYGAAAGAALFLYLVWRVKNSKTKPKE